MGKSPCCEKDAGLNRGAWTAQEDCILNGYISIHGEGRWRALPKKAGLKRCGKSCRLWLINYLRPDIKRGNISPDEKELIIRMHKLLGNRWSLIAARLPGRTDNEIKNYLNTHLSKNRLPEKETLCEPQKGHTKLKPARVLKCTPVKAPAVTIGKNRDKYVDGSDSDHQDLRSTDVPKTVKASKCWCELLVDDISTEINFEFNDQRMTEKIAESMEILNWHSPRSTFNLDNLPFLHSQHSAEMEVYASHMSSFEVDLLSSPCGDFRIKDLFTRLSDDLEQRSNVQQVNFYRAADGGVMGEIYSETQQQDDWVTDLQFF